MKDKKENKNETVKTNEKMTPGREVVMEDDNAADANESLKLETFGVVAGCEKLNVRKKPNTDAEIISVVGSGEKLLIDHNAPTSAGWISVCTAAGVSGFCMGRYVAVEES